MVDMGRIRAGLIAELLRREARIRSQREALEREDPHTARDAAACRAVEIRQLRSDGRPQFFMPDLGE